jgi:PhzF family phenazine biosynthesis protein
MAAWNGKSLMKNSTTRKFMQCDVFADTAGAGNALGVVLNGEHLSSEQMQAFAKFTNLSETTFVLPVSHAEASYRVRIFTPMSELPFAGHPSVGTAHALLEAGVIHAYQGRFIQECAAGLLPIVVEGDGKQRMVSVRAPRARIIAPASHTKHFIDAVLSNMSLGSLPATLMNNGPSWWCVELRDEAAVRELEPLLNQIATLTNATNAVGLAVFAKSDAADYQWVVRAFCPADNIPEDPVTGSANAAIAALLHHHNKINPDNRQYIASQGREMGRNGFVHVRIDDEGEVWIGGKTQTVIRGDLSW